MELGINRAIKTMEKIINPALLLLLLMVMFVSLHTGSAPISVLTALQDKFSGSVSLDAMVIFDIRLPRTMLAALIGAALGLSGAALQGLLRNPLAEPGLIGASQGAALGAATVFYFGLLPFAGSIAPAFAGLIGAGLCLALMLLLAGNASQSMVIMAGLAISTLSGAALAVVLNYAPNPYAMQELVFWLLGSVADRGMSHVLIVLIALLLGSVIIWSQRRLLYGLSLGETVAASLGLNHQHGSRWIMLAVALLVGSAVSVAGTIGFVGLVVPHLLRPIVGSRPDRLLLPASLAGAALVTAADIVVRLLPSGQELKLGVLTSLLGVPVFIWLVWRERKQWL
jgi:iron complex transport system permease protein